jgi:hypothetical protein
LKRKLKAQHPGDTAARERLQAIIQVLESQAGPHDDEARDAARRIGDFLNGRYPSLDAAFGLIAGPGAPRQKMAEHLAFARDAERLGLQAALAKHARHDEREARRILKANRPRLVAERIIDRRKAGDAARESERRRKRRGAQGG